jgi:hypothetical protein|tara:strand:- start:11738 stop:12271 length:534 start_codon:yes stop_codon:yes gene_type:complete
MEKLDEETRRLKKITEKAYGVHLSSNRRTRDNVDAKRVFSLIMKERGYGCSQIGRMLDKTHATVLHYWRTSPGFIDSDIQLAEKYNAISNDFYCNIKEMNDVNNEGLTKRMSLLEEENKSTTLANKQLEKKIKLLTQEIDNHKDYEVLYNIIRERTKPKTQSFIAKKLNTFYNGVYS